MSGGEDPRAADGWPPAGPPAAPGASPPPAPPPPIAQPPPVAPPPPPAGDPGSTPAKPRPTRSNRWVAVVVGVVVVAALAAGLVVFLSHGSQSTSGATASNASSAWTLSGAINATATIERTHKCPESVTLVDHSGNEYEVTLGGPAQDGTVGVTDPAVHLLSVSSGDLSDFWFSIEAPGYGSFPGVGNGASGTVTRTGNTFSIDATLVPWTRLSPQTTGQLHIRGTVSC